MNRGSKLAKYVSLNPHMASMRPRFMNRGSEIDQCRLCQGFDRASMRPRFMNRGSRIVSFGMSLA